MKRLLLALVAIALLCPAAFAQVTATVTDADGQTWNNGTWVTQLGCPGGSVPTIAAVPVTPLFARGTLSGTGGLTAALTPTNTLDQTGCLWTFTLQPNASVPPTVIAVPVTSATQNLSSALSTGLKAPRFPAGVGAFGYQNAEILPSPSLGAQYQNVTLGCLVTFTVNGWSGCSSSGGATITAANGNLVSGTGTGNGQDSGIAAANVGTLDANGRQVQSQVPVLLPIANLTQLVLLDQNDATTGIAHDKSGNGNNCPLPATGSTFAMNAVGTGGAYSASFSTSNTTTLIDCTAITTAGTVVLIMGGTPISVAATAFSGPIMGCGITNCSLELFLQNKLYTAGNAYLVSGPGVTSPIALSPNYQIVTTDFSAGAIYQGSQFVPYLDKAAGLVQSIPGGGHLQIGGSNGNGFTGGAGAKGVNYLGWAVYTGAWSQTNANQLTAALNNYYKARGVDLTYNPPTSVAPTPYMVTCVDSSLGAGLGLTTTPCGAMTLGANYTVNVSAVSSSATIGHYLSQAYPEAFYMRPTAGRNIVVLGGPTNDICESASYVYGGNSTPANIWAYTVGYIAKIHAIDPNALVVVGTMISRTGTSVSPNTGSCDANKNTVNAIIRANAYSIPNVALTDLAEPPNIGADGANSGTIGTIEACPGATTYFQSDCVHVTSAGQAFYTQSIQAAIQAATGSTSGNPDSITATSFTLTPSNRVVNLNPTGVATGTLPDCTGLTGVDFFLRNLSSFAITLSGVNGQTITGSAVIAANAVAKYAVQLISASAGGCYLLRTQ